MKDYYDIVLKNEAGGSISYWADSFSVDEYRILRVKSVEFGDVTVSIRDDERMFVSEVSVKDELDEFLSDWGLEAGDILPPGYPESRCSGQGEPLTNPTSDPEPGTSSRPCIRKAGAADKGNPPDKFDQEPLTGKNPPAPASGKPVQQTKGKQTTI